MLQKKWTIYVFHNAHTDIGYTERQERLMVYHYEYIKQALDILDAIHERPDENESYKGFKWQCETFWMVKNFYERATEDEISRFERYYRSGEIGISGNYLNTCDLLDMEVLKDALDEVVAYGQKTGRPVTAGMCADVNGLPWGYADAAYEHGIRYFYSMLHADHGMFPLYRKHIPFYWESPKGYKILMWNADHIGNELFLSPHAGGSYMCHEDRYADGSLEASFPHMSAGEIDAAEFDMAVHRIEAYLENFEAEGYPYDFIPTGCFSVMTDNAPPGRGYMRRIRELNRHFGGRITLVPVTLEDFFKVVEEKCGDIPTYRGDFTDWWSEGPVAEAHAAKLYLEAVRKYHLCKKLDPCGAYGSGDDLRRACADLMLYAEHTFSYSSSCAQPWDTMVRTVELKKTAFAAHADSILTDSYLRLMRRHGLQTFCERMSQCYLIMNPHDMPVKQTAALLIESWETIDGRRYQPGMPVEVTDCRTKKTLPCQLLRLPRAVAAVIQVNLEPHGRMDVQIHIGEKTYYSLPSDTLHARPVHEMDDMLPDVHYWNNPVRPLPEKRIDENCIETDFFRMTADTGGIRTFEYKDGSSLLRADMPFSPFEGLYEATQLSGGDPCAVRIRLGRARRTYSTKKYRAQLVNRALTENGPVFATLRMDYELEGTQFYTVLLTFYHHLPKVDVQVRMHKDSRWEPENVFAALPFTAGADSIFYIDKTGCIMRPGLDQLPGTLQDYYLTQHTIAWKGEKKTVSVTAKDAPLIQLGRLEPGRVKLCSGSDLAQNGAFVWSWMLNNYWETNFNVNLGGFYEFRYTLDVSENESIEQTFARCTAENEGLITEHAR